MLDSIGIKAVSFSLLFHYYYMNCQMEGYDRNWNGTIACLGKHFREVGPKNLRDSRNSLPKLQNAGWHFSYLGGLEKATAIANQFKIDTQNNIA
jgi:beta-1,4-mannosyl-glycoprotein beta-1,4-N-acetylglucosaminyltransferase